MPFLGRSPRLVVEDLLALADIRIGGDRPWDIAVHNECFYRRVLAQGSLGLGEAYMDGWWSCRDLSELFFRICRARLEGKIPWNLPIFLAVLRARLFNLQNRRRSKKVAREHYDLGNEFYAALLDPYNQYTCGYFQGTDGLNEAQVRKLELQCRKLQLQRSDCVLDIGCGWGGFAKYATERYGCHVTGLTISHEQATYARSYCRGLPVEILECDYRDVRGSFDKVLVCGMIEHVGMKNYRMFMESVRHVLKDDGLFLLHTIGNNVSQCCADPWITRYIFPNSMIPSLRQMMEAIEGLFVMEDWHNFGAFYTQTLFGWYRNFVHHWPRFALCYGERFRRMWEYYLLSCAGGFRARAMQLWQIVLSKQGVAGGYTSLR